MSTSTAAPAGKIQPRLKQKYRSEIAKQLQEEFGYANVNQIPGLVKIVVNVRPCVSPACDWAANTGR